jgi:chaperone LolA
LDDEFFDFETFTASFTQSIVSENHDSLSKTSGELFISKPNSILWHVKLPTERIVLIENNIISIYDPDLNQVLKSDIDIFEEAKWIKVFTDRDARSNLESITERSDSSTRIIYRSLLLDSQLREFVINKDDEKIRSVTINLSGKDKFEITMDRVEINPNISDDFFYSLIPANAEVIVQ